MINVKDTLNRKLEIKDAFFADDGQLMMAVKDGNPERVDLGFYMKSYFNNGETFNISISAKTESEPDPEPVDVTEDDEDDEE